MQPTQVTTLNHLYKLKFVIPHQGIDEINQFSSIKVAEEINRKISSKILQTNDNNTSAFLVPSTRTIYLEHILFYRSKDKHDSQKQVVFIQFNKPTSLDISTIENVQNDCIVWLAIVTPCSFKKIHSKFNKRSFMVARKGLQTWTSVCPKHLSKQELFDKTNSLTLKSEFLRFENNCLKQDKEKLQKRINVLESELEQPSNKKKKTLLIDSPSLNYPNFHSNIKLL